MNKKHLLALLCVTVASSAAFADELHNETFAAHRDLQQSIDEMHAIHQEYGGQFGGHLSRAEALSRQAEHENAQAIDYYRRNHAGWQ